MAIWIDRKKAAKRRRSPGVTPKSEQRAMGVQSQNVSDLRRKGERAVIHDEIFDGAAIKNIKAKAKKLKADAKSAEKQKVKDDHSKDFGADDESK